MISGCLCSGQDTYCDDGIPCTFDACNEAAGGCVSMPNDALCDDLDPSNGVETCDVTLGCQPGTPPCLDPVVDANNHSYETVQIQGQCWFAENLQAKSYADYTTIASYLSDADWEVTVEGSWQIPGGLYDNLSTYGRLYNWYAVNDPRGICPSGWHVPTDAELTILTDALAGLAVAGGALKEDGTLHWNDPNVGATNSSGFTALPAGQRTVSGGYSNMNSHAYFWSSTSSGGAAIARSLFSGNDNVMDYTTNLHYGYSVRCLQD
jgi:uncharacterized protein (TIGR02145 family)